MDELREALERLPEANVVDELQLWSQRGRDLRLVAAAARRFLALTETGPDYEAAIKLDWKIYDKAASVQERADQVRAIVDVALADYLTEEDR